MPRKKKESVPTPSPVEPTEESKQKTFVKKKDPSDLKSGEIIVRRGKFLVQFN
jgi:hypothetical protein